MLFVVHDAPTSMGLLKGGVMSLPSTSENALEEAQLATLLDVISRWTGVFSAARASVFSGHSVRG